jgi:glutamine---fructose-6-phosphate transaminase (isomerizing)
VAVVHNGIIENFRTLRAELEEAGVTFESATDTETVAQLCARELRAGLPPLEAARATLARLDGAFALAFLFEGEPDLMIGARRGSPLAVGFGAGEMYLGSDALALAPLSNRVAYLEEGDHVVLTRDGATFYDEADDPVEREQRFVPLENVYAEKGPHRHFMAKEIHEQPSVVANALAHYLAPDRRSVSTGARLDWAGASRLVMVACGTAHYATHVSRYWFERVAGLPVEIDVASEFRYREPPIGPGTIALFVSQSGETADTLAALRYAKAQGATIVSVVNVETSTIARESAHALPILAGPEIGVASTKAFTAQLVTLAVLALEAARARGQLDEGDEARFAEALATLPGLLSRALLLEPEIDEAARDLARADNILFLGRGPLYPLALEGALKLKETSYIHAEGFAAGELKHGPIALVDETVPVVVFAPSDGYFDKVVSNMQEVMARDGRVLLVTDRAGLTHAAEGTWRTLRMPTCDPFVAPILYAVPAQLLAYHTAVTKGTDVDQPRNLAKSVTVE